MENLKKNKLIITFLIAIAVIFISFILNIKLGDNLEDRTLLNFTTHITFLIIIILILVIGRKNNKLRNDFYNEKAVESENELMKYKKLITEFKQEFSNKDKIWEKRVISIKKNQEKLQQELFAKSMELDQVKTEFKEKMKKQEALNQELFRRKLEFEQLNTEMFELKNRYQLS